MFENATNSKKQGDIGMGSAIAWFTINSYTVCIPLTDSQDYDLVVEKDDGLKKVQVRTSTQLLESGGYALNLRTMGGNRSWNGAIKVVSKETSDLLFAVADNGDCYLIPTDKITARNSIVLGLKWSEYKL
jgi:hypothetical protein